MGGISVQLGLDNAHQPLVEGITYLHDIRYWPTLWTLVGYAAAHLSRTSRPFPAAVLWGYLQAHQPPIIAPLEKSLTFPGIPISNGSGTEQASSEGGAMDRSEIVAYAVSVLSDSSRPTLPPGQAAP
jgi:hypothetical protein